MEIGEVLKPGLGDMKGCPPELGQAQVLGTQWLSSPTDIKRACVWPILSVGLSGLSFCIFRPKDGPSRYYYYFLCADPFEPMR